MADLSPVLIPLAAMVVPVAIVAIIYWHKTRQRELEMHREMRLREMEHERSLKQTELDIERLRAAQRTEKVV
jgi:hypothetical protein